MVMASWSDRHIVIYKADFPSTGPEFSWSSSVRSAGLWPSNRHDTGAAREGNYCQYNTDPLQDSNDVLQDIVILQR